MAGPMPYLLRLAAVRAQPWHMLKVVVARRVAKDCVPRSNHDDVPDTVWWQLVLRAGLHLRQRSASAHSNASACQIIQR